MNQKLQSLMGSMSSLESGFQQSTGLTQLWFPGKVQNIPVLLPQGKLKIHLKDGFNLRWSKNSHDWNRKYINIPMCPPKVDSFSSSSNVLPLMISLLFSVPLSVLNCTEPYTNILFRWWFQRHFGKYKQRQQKRILKIRPSLDLQTFSESVKSLRSGRQSCF